MPHPDEIGRFPLERLDLGSENVLAGTQDPQRGFAQRLPQLLQLGTQIQRGNTIGRRGHAGLPCSVGQRASGQITGNNPIETAIRYRARPG